MNKEQYYPPEYLKGHFHCPHCNVYANQKWSHILAMGDAYTTAQYYSNLRDCQKITKRIIEEEWVISFCEHCNQFAIWKKERMIFPKRVAVKEPNTDLLEDIQADYIEAANILDDSPRASAALLRLALQKLCIQLGEDGKNINDNIAELVGKGLNPTIQKSLDVLRINGNNAVHPGEINLSEDRERVVNLFRLINYIAEKMLTEPKEINDFYEDLPESSKDAVIKRDSN